MSPNIEPDSVSEAINHLVAMPVMVVVASDWWNSLDPLKKATAALIVVSTVSFGLGSVIATQTSSLLQTPAAIDSVRAEQVIIQSEVADNRAGIQAVVERLDTLICELRTERLGNTPPECNGRLLR